MLIEIKFNLVKVVFAIEETSIYFNRQYDIKITV